MCGIAGYFNSNIQFETEMDKHRDVVGKMGEVIAHRGPDADGVVVKKHCALAHRRLAVIDPEGGRQPMVKKVQDKDFVIVYNGELYNTDEVRDNLKKRGWFFETSSDTEVVLTAYIEYGEACVEHFNGIFGFAIWNPWTEGLFLCRDRFGIKPLFYMEQGDTFLFASEIKGILAYPSVSPVIDKKGLCEIFGVGPARSPGCGVFQGIKEIPPGYAMHIEKEKRDLYCYWSLTASEHTDSYEQTVEKTRYLLFDAIERQLVSDVPICTLLSGGIDSSIVSSVASSFLRKQGKVLDTYSFDYKDNSKYFKASSFQPSEDRPYVDIMVDYIKSHHTYLECETPKLLNFLKNAVRAKDLPGMVDVDSSLFYFCREIKKNHTVCLSGECADEIFGGYPWFRDEEVYKKKAFPWSKNFDFRKEIIAPDILEMLPLEEYVQEQYDETMKRVSKLEEETALKKRQREISYLNTAWFMTTLLDRKDRMTMASGLEVRVPFADHRLVQYLYNVPWEFKYRNQVVKGLLRDAAKDVLPEEVLWRKKSPYPKTYDPAYEEMLKNTLRPILENKNAPLHQLIHHEAISRLMECRSDLGRPWFGQLMAQPQMYAYLFEINYWLEHYQIKIDL
ncbi:asparagine synthase (glutamine-hydrolyzing) [Anaeromicropila populeti]|uniref:asparagine synthase (glutamine-hydrolyzing) n=1 Tax=Anaeromicropila populeti TaxID=37658 RepID=A0A1I6JWH6_9FIRM|nr:asparagine synthase (glutamine-hydrolyzing) [Anaeromicropila populeti]SFR83248.1 asparagine synthase (glutamine-hydrolysing) [Anaeromicropila populeti]